MAANQLDPHAGDCEIKEVVIETIPGDEWDISLIMVELNVYESIFNHTISAEIVIDDTDNKIKNFPITGHEWVRFTFDTPGKSEIVQHLRIYKISSRQLEKDKRQMYILHCVSDVEYTNAQLRISKAYKNMLISDIATDIQENFLDSSFDTLETTKNLFHIIPSYWSPFYTMSFLAARANSASYKGSNYVYYQTVDGFNFVSIEKLCDTVPVVKYLSQPGNIRDLSVVDGYKPRTIDVDQVSVISYRFETNFDTLENIVEGMYSNTLLTHDIVKKQFSETNFDYPSSYNNYIHVEPNSVTGGSSRLWTSKSDMNGSFAEHRFYPLGQPEQPSYVGQWLQQRISQMQQIQNVRMFVTIPGDSDRRSGQLVQFDLPSPEPLVQNQLQMDIYYTNRYLVLSVQHQVHKSQYVTILEIVKDSVANVWP